MNKAEDEDIFNMCDTVSLEELAEEWDADLLVKLTHAAGIDDLTPTDTFMQLQGDKSFVSLEEIET
jgi:hypothetical protein